MFRTDDDLHDIDSNDRNTFKTKLFLFFMYYTIDIDYV